MGVGGGTLLDGVKGRLWKGWTMTGALTGSWATPYWWPAVASASPASEARATESAAYEKAVFPTLDEQAKSKEIITKQWDAVVGANVK